MKTWYSFHKHDTIFAPVLYRICNVSPSARHCISDTMPLGTDSVRSSPRLPRVGNFDIRAVSQGGIFDMAVNLETETVRQIEERPIFSRFTVHISINLSNL